ncbi:hypothetical protein E2C01_021535 [Portunus trituberculatus]|uniref:Uncharacterized protein n=1 Tax=Portunus trituberculatus TaxID=210409 RepID=A0A5B7E6C6_PORTR|nr:hypothetical protein [Portunus trituberculatus]
MLCVGGLSLFGNAGGLCSSLLDNLRLLPPSPLWLQTRTAASELAITPTLYKGISLCTNILTSTEHYTITRHKRALQLNLTQPSPAQLRLFPFSQVSHVSPVPGPASHDRLMRSLSASPSSHSRQKTSDHLNFWCCCRCSTKTLTSYCVLSTCHPAILPSQHTSSLITTTTTTSTTTTPAPITAIHPYLTSYEP